MEEALDLSCDITDDEDDDVMRKVSVTFIGMNMRINSITLYLYNENYIHLKIYYAKLIHSWHESRFYLMILKQNFQYVVQTVDQFKLSKPQNQ